MVVDDSAGDHPAIVPGQESVVADDRPPGRHQGDEQAEQRRADEDGDAVVCGLLRGDGSLDGAHRDDAHHEGAKAREPLTAARTLGRRQFARVTSNR